MEEATIISVVEKLRDLIYDGAIKKYRERTVKELINELEKFIILVREKKLEYRKCKLKYLISEVFERSRNAYHQLKENNDFEENWYLGSDLMEINRILREGEGRVGSKNDGVGEYIAVGLERDVELLLHKINNSRENTTFVVKIQGIPGSGKTTLARHLFNHTQVVQNFEPRIWVNCMDILSKKELLIKLIGQLGNDDSEYVEKMEYTQLKDKLNQRLQDKPFLIVLDNVNPPMTYISIILNQAKTQSALLLISPHMDRWDSSDCVHEMKPLDLDKSWELLLKTMFSGINKFPKHVERKAKAMLMKHCGGLPLAIKEMAMEWAEKRRFGAEWEDIVESEDLELRTTLEALDSNVYRSLTSDHKSVFLHLGFFKLGTIIRAQRLVHTLTASGNKHSKCLSDLNVYRMIEVERSLKKYRPKTVRVISTLHKLSIKKLRECDEGASYAAIYCSRERFSCSMDQNERLICVSFNGGGCFDDSPSYWKCFKQLRVLDFEDFGLKFLPETVGELIELRYLGLRNNYIEELPHSLGNLKNLEVLDIALNFMVKVPDIIWQMDALVHLYMSDIICTKPLKIEALLNLETITYISIDNWAYDLSGLQMMSKLCRLGIEGLDGNPYAAKLFLSLALLENLRILELRGFRFRSMRMFDMLRYLNGLDELKLDGLITVLPSPENFPPKLRHLTLVNSCLDDDPMPILEKLERLVCLKLRNAYTGQQMVISEDGFPMLERMYIAELWQLRNIQFGQGGLYWFKILEITNCPLLHTLPIKKELRLKVTTTKKMAAHIKKSGLFSETAYIDIQP